MIDTYLFDWGDTLMIDFPDVPGKMCDWEVVEAVDGAKEALGYLSQHAKIYIATGAADSSEADIAKAFARVGLSQYISGYFCQANLGLAKGMPEFLPAIIDRLGIPKERIAMVGDTLAKDIEPALAAGIKPIWLCRDEQKIAPENVQIIGSLRALCA
ncbi:HAD family hydrolase [Pontibacterium granulatum]|uniref:HAD family hydrolase n=1 Tax=Pontibacterium granulatum TaxID=2036029 RepID=UPI00249B0B37|nr:HAD family hydrolase [Pontibacterium granulatum]MDI3324787.1 HAD family hydrolase [Pontibacterium granulatum]